MNLNRYRDRAALLRMAPAALLAHVIDVTMARMADSESLATVVLRQSAAGVTSDEEVPF